MLIILAVSLLIIPVKWILAWHISVIIHEMGHFLAIKILGGQVISFRICGHSCQMESTAVSDIKALLCQLAGPIAGLIPLLFARYIPRIAVCGLFHSLYNLLPIYPLDGGKVLRIVINRFKQ